MKKVLLFMAILYGLQAPAQFYHWANDFGSTNGGEQGHKVITDASGNIYMIGNFFGTVDFDPSAATANLSSTNAFTQDVFIAKYDPYGAYLWAFNIGGGTTTTAFANDIVLDPTGNYIYVTGSFQGTADFDPSASTANLTSAAGDDAFLAEYTIGGAYVNAFKMGGSLNDEGYGVACDPSGNVYVTGAFETTVDFDPSASTANLTATGVNDVFIAKYTSALAYVWAGKLGGSNTDYGYGIKANATNVYVIGSFAGTADFDPSAATANLTSNGNLDVFVGKYTSAGAYVSAFKIGGAQADYGYELALDASNNVYITGSFQGTADFDPSAAVANQTSVGSSDVFVGKYTSALAYTLAFKIGSTLADVGNDIKVDGTSANIYITGSFAGTADFDPSATTHNLTTTMTSEMFVAKYSSALAYGYAINASGNNADYGYGIAVDASNNVFATGSFNSLADFDPSAGVANLTSVGGDDIYLVKYAPAACNPSTSPTVTANTTSFCAGGSDTLKITAGSLNDASHWQWYTGSCGGTPAGSGTTLGVSPASTTTYYVRGEGGCVTTGACISYTITVNPLPVPSVTGNTSVSCFGGNNGTLTLSVSSGTSPFTYSWSNGSTSQNVGGLTAGSYTVHVTDANGCTGSTSATLTQPALALTTILSHNTLACYGDNNGTVTTTTSGGTPGYTYSWSNSASTQNVNGLTAGTYSVTITDSHGCTTNGSATITQPTQITFTGTQTNVSCFNGTDGSITPTITGGTPGYNYSWSNGAVSQTVSNLTAGTYTITVTDQNGCVVTNAYTVTQPPLLTASATSTPDTVANDGTISLTVNGGTSPYTYSWSNGILTQNQTGLTGGSYTVTVTDSNGCTANTTVIVNSSVGIAVYDNNQEFKVYPNPGTDVVFIEIKELNPSTLVQITDLPGHLVYSRMLTENRSRLELGMLDRGIYFVKLRVNGTDCQAQKIILE